MRPVQHAEQRTLDQAGWNVGAQAPFADCVPNEAQQRRVERAGLLQDFLRPGGLLRLQLVHLLLNVDEGGGILFLIADHQRDEDIVQPLDGAQRRIAREGSRGRDVDVDRKSVV